MGPTFLYGDSDTPPHLVAFYDHAGDTEVHILDLTPRVLTGVDVKKPIKLKTCFETFSWNFAYDFVLLHIKFEFR